MADAYNNHQSKLEWSYDGGGPIFYPADLRMYEFTLHKIKYTNVTTDYGIFGKLLILPATAGFLMRIANHIEL